MDSKIDLETQGGRGGREIDPRDEMTVPRHRSVFLLERICYCGAVSFRAHSAAEVAFPGFFQNRKNAKVGTTIAAAETCAK
jgi:hypothetical protein